MARKAIAGVVKRTKGEHPQHVTEFGKGLKKIGGGGATEEH